MKHKLITILFFAILPLTLIVGVFIYSPNLRTMAFNGLQNLFWGFGSSIQEAAPPSYQQLAYAYGVSGLLAIGGLIIAIKYRIGSLFLFWAMVMFMASLGEQRWEYYAAVPIGLCAAYFIQWIIKHVEPSWRAVATGFAIVPLLAVSLPGVLGLIAQPGLMTREWNDALVWMKDNTPTPTVSYYQDGHDKPDYGVLSWWDYGNWVEEIAQRPAVVTPQQQITTLYQFFTAPDELSADKFLEGTGVRYVIITDEMVGGKFHAIPLRLKQTYGIEANTVLQQSFVYQLWNSDGVGHYKLDYASQKIRIYERITP
jgi:asparagine N-glycosylation enzyme membrane subunit Stt3